MSSHEVPPSMESYEDEWSDEDSESEGERQAADDNDDHYTTVMVVNPLLSVWREAVNSVSIMNQLMTEDNDAFVDHVEGDFSVNLNRPAIDRLND
jgi:hypothetical protein